MPPTSHSFLRLLLVAALAFVVAVPDGCDPSPSTPC
jgi:hypothetical protein